MNENSSIKIDPAEISKLHTITHIETGATHTLFGKDPIDCIQKFINYWPISHIQQDWMITCMSQENELELRFSTNEEFLGDPVS